MELEIVFKFLESMIENKNVFDKTVLTNKPTTINKRKKERGAYFFSTKSRL